jgi:hypothetical protein
MTAVPDVLSDARKVGVLGYVIELDGVARLALAPAEAAPLLGLEAETVRNLCRAGRLRARNLHPGSRNGRYLIPVGALVEYLAGRDDPVPSSYT